MGRSYKFAGRAAAVALGLALVAAVGVPSVAAAAGPPEFPQCPAAGPDTGCGALVTINPDGSASVAVDASQPALDGGSGLLIGIQNNSDVTATSVALSGPGAFALSGRGVCTVHPSPCFSAHEYGPTGYEGPGTSLAPTDSSDGTVDFAGGIGAGGYTYFSLSGSPVTVTSVALTQGLDVTATPLSAYTSVPFSGQVASFYDGTSVAPAGNFTATVDWGDGASDAGAVITQPGGPGTAYVVSDGHTYGVPGDYTVTVDVTDTTAPAGYDSQSATATADVTTLAVTITPATIPAQEVGAAFSGEVATFTSSVASAGPGAYAVTLDWGDGTTSPGTVTQPGGPGTPFDVSGTHTYSTSAEFSITVEVTYAGVTTDGSVPIEVDAAQGVVTCEGSCSGGVTSPEQTSTVTTSSGSGSVYVSLLSGTFSCTSTAPYSSAPQITTVVTSGIPSSVVVNVRVKFLRKDLQGTVGAPIRACFAGSEPFTTYGGGTATPEIIDGQSYYVGLLPGCRPGKVMNLPCLIHHGWASVPTGKYVVERIRFPAGDPKFH